MNNEPTSSPPPPQQPAIPPPVPAAPARPLPASRPVDKQWALEPIDGPVSFAATIESLLKTPGRILHECAQGSRKVPFLLMLGSVVCLAVFGLLLGSFSGAEQYWAAPLKVTLGTLFAVIICLPSLYIFSALDGLDSKLYHMAAIIIAAVALTSLLLMGFAPVLWVFSQSTDGLPFMGFLAVAFWLISLVFGLRFLLAAAASMGAVNFGYLKTWICIFVVVTLQMSTALRPIIGRADTLLPKEKRFFLGHWFDQLNEASKNTETTRR